MGTKTSVWGGKRARSWREEGQKRWYVLSIEHFSCVSALWDGIWQVGGWALGLHTHSIPNCGWDVKRNAEGLAGQHQVPLLRTSWDLG